MSGDYQIDSLLSGYKWQSNTITFSFFNGGKYYGTETVSPVSDAVKQNVRYILRNIIQPLINVNFVEVSDSETSYGQIRYMSSNNARYAYAYYPTGTNQAGDVLLNPDFDHNLDTNGFQGGVGTHGFMSLIHETLHALGLKHVGHASEPPSVPSSEDNTTNSVMTYNFTGNSAANPMPYDIKALQYLYGARSYNSGNTTYTFDTVFGYSDGSQYRGSTTKATKLSIWDSGGVDTLNFSRLRTNDSYRFDLREGGMLTSKSAYNATSYEDWDDTTNTTYYTTTNGTAIAYGVTIENVIGSASSDTIIGNDAGNNFRGGTGNDYLQGNAGNDILAGNAGNDTIDGGTGIDTVSYQSVTSAVNVNLATGIALDGQGGRDTLLNIELINGSAYNDTLIGNSVNNSFAGGSGNDVMNGDGGNDSFNGGLGNDTLNGGAGIDIANYQNATSAVNVNLGTGVALDGQAGRDSLMSIEVVIGSSYNDTLTGNAANNNLTGGNGNDLLNGGAGSDVLMGSAGNDILYGGLNADNFVFSAVSQGIDVIKDFSRVGGDKIQIQSASFGATATNLNLFTYNSATGALNFNGNQFATLNTNSGFQVTTDIIFI
jgi:Ca2+-binding RTX toxin-like protein